MRAVWRPEWKVVMIVPNVPLAPSPRGRRNGYRVCSQSDSGLAGGDCIGPFHLYNQMIWYPAVHALRSTSVARILVAPLARLG
jgi:hypothetical protein